MTTRSRWDIEPTSWSASRSGRSSGRRRRQRVACPGGPLSPAPADPSGPRSERQLQSRRNGVAARRLQAWQRRCRRLQQHRLLLLRMVRPCYMCRSRRQCHLHPQQLTASCAAAAEAVVSRVHQARCCWCRSGDVRMVTFLDASVMPTPCRFPAFDPWALQPPQTTTSPPRHASSEHRGGSPLASLRVRGAVGMCLATAVPAHSQVCAAGGWACVVRQASALLLDCLSQPPTSPPPAAVEAATPPPLPGRPGRRGG